MVNKGISVNIAEEQYKTDLVNQSYLATTAANPPRRVAA